ncbi:MAG: hypothetical protein WC766_06240 [Patescibacteria group bacterium]|jgi:multisubunit Na+/H+ antiporter MnhB subunit
MKLSQFAQNKELAQGFAGVIVGVFVAVLIGAVLLGPIQTSITTTKNSSTAPPTAATNSTIDNLPLLFGVLLLVGVLGAMIAVIR